MSQDQSNLLNDLERILYSEEDLAAMNRRLGEEITRAYSESVKKRKLIMVGVLKGSFIFMADLVRQIPLPMETLFLRASSYGNGTESSGKVTISEGPDKSIFKEADVLFVEDILDSGRTLKKLQDYMLDAGAHSVKICTMLDKPARRVVDITVDFRGFELENAFTVGYGLDYAEEYRNLPVIGVLKESIYTTQN